MKKHLLLIGLFITSATTLFAGTGTITVTSMPTTIEAGTTAAITVQYTSDAACKLNVAIFKTKANGTDLDWNTYQTQVDVTGLSIAASPTSVNVNVPLPAGMTPSASLPAGVKYVWCFQLNDGPNSNYAWNNSPSTNSFTVTPSSVVADAINFTVTPKASVAQGEQVTVDIEYTLVAESSIKVSVSEYSTSWAYFGDVVKVELNNEPATTTTPVKKSVVITIPTDAKLSSTLAADRSHKWDIGIYTTSGTYKVSNKSNATIIAGNSTAVKNANTSIELIATQGGVSVRNAEGQSIQIYNMAGAKLNSSVAQSSNEFISLPKGIYVVTIGSQSSKVCVK